MQKTKNHIDFPFLTLLIAIMGVIIVFSVVHKLEDVYASPEIKSTLVIDAGHGGIDGGAVAEDGTKECDINLAISLKLMTLAEFYGENTVMTRIDNRPRTDMESYSEREDLIHRTEIINGVQNAALISVHQNSYPTGQPSGAQVLYAQSESSKAFGTITHANLINALDPANRRVAEPAPESLYITSHAACPAILVECGFMSNFSDIQKLKDNIYQTQLATVLMASYFRKGI